MSNLKKLLLIIILVAMVAPTFVLAQSCSDSDGGQDIYVKGTMTKDGKSATDFCLEFPKDTVDEYYCTDLPDFMSNKTFKCDFICSDGACVNPTVNSDSIKAPVPAKTTGDLYTVSWSRIDCPSNVKEFLKEQNLTAEIEPTCSIINVPIISDRETVKPVRIAYARRGGTSQADDVVYSLTYDALLSDAGKLLRDNGIFSLPKNFSYNSGAIVAKLYNDNFKTDTFFWDRGGDRYVNLRGSIEGPLKSGDYCGTYVPIYPVTGEFVVCSNPGMNYPKIYGTAGWDTGVMPYPEASEKGKATAESGYIALGIPRDQLNISIMSRLQYRKDLKSWLISYKQKGANNLVVKITSTGDSCPVAMFEAREMGPRP